MDFFSSKPTDSSFTITNDKEKQQILPFKKMFDIFALTTNWLTGSNEFYFDRLILDAQVMLL